MKRFITLASFALLAACNGRSSSRALDAVVRPAHADEAAPPKEGCNCAHDCGDDHGVPAPEKTAAEAPVRIDLANAPSKGDAAAKVTVVVFSDFECPFCARGADTLHALEQRYGHDVRLVFKNNPLPFHTHARAAALAALAADEQGKFWALHDRLFAHRGELDEGGIGRQVEEAGLDTHAFRLAVASPRLAQRLDADVAEAQRLGVQGTPTFFVNGRRVVGAQPVEAFARLIDEELRK